MANILRVTKEFNFEMAHALQNHDGLCKHIHGHSYHLEVTVKGIVNKSKGASGEGMVIDFSVLKNIVSNHISLLDHALLLQEDVSEIIGNNQHSLFQRSIKVPFTPTCENILLHLVGRIKNELPRETQLASVKLRETSSSYAEWNMEDNL